jgi:hypothetical protein
VLKKKVWANFQRIIELFTKKMVKKLFKIWSWDPGSEIWDPGSGKNPFRIPDPGVKKAPDPGSRIRIRNTGGNTDLLDEPEFLTDVVSKTVSIGGTSTDHLQLLHLHLCQLTPKPSTSESKVALASRQCCGTGMFIRNPGGFEFFPYRIPDPPQRI